MPEVTLPSGLRGNIREIGIIEENVLSDKQLARSGKNLTRVFSNCWLETLDAGIYDFPKDFDPDMLLQGDGMALLFHLRTETYGPQFLFDVNCPRCHGKITWELDLNEYLKEKTKLLPESSKAILKGDKVFETFLPRCGKKVKFALLTLSQERRFPDLRRKEFDKLSSVVLDMMVIEIEGIKLKRCFLGLEPYPANYEGEKLIMSSADATELRDAIETVNCGVNTTFEIECMDCGEVSMDLPFQEGFLVPKKRKK